jgi:Domain of unknown function (DUF1929)/Divergent InlB B-repeat domain
MRRATAALPAVTLGIVILLQSCQDGQFTEPDQARTKPPRSLTITGAGMGHGRVTAPPVGEVILDCKIDAGSYNPTDCTKMYGWKSSVTMTASPDPGSSFAGWSGACTGTGSTCKVTMTQARSVSATFSGQGLPSFALNVVGGGNGNGSVQSQPGPTPAIDCGITAGTAGSGTCSGSYQSGTSITLIASGASGHTFDGWDGDCSGTGNCVLSITANRSVTAIFTAPLGPEATVGKWDPPFSTPVIGLHLSHVAGKVLLWGHGGEPNTWNPAGGGFTQVPNNTCSNPSNCELFCSGHTFLPDGRLLVAGGHNESLGDGNGIKQASIFNGSSWMATDSMSYGRWYPTLVGLENGDVVALSGSQDPSLNASYPERYNGSNWTTLSGAQRSLPLFPRAFLEPKNGWIFYAGEGSSIYLNPTGSGSWTTVGLGNGGAKVVSSRSYGSAVMVDSKVLYVGGGGGSCPTLPERRAEVIDLAAASPTWVATDSMAIRRRQTNATILADGMVLVTGGSSQCGFTTEAGAVFAAEAWDPATGKWTTWSNASVVRVYHSTTTLLPDARVLSTGSGDGGGVTQQYTYEIFSPPYLFKGPRPTYNLGPAPMRYGQPFAVQTPNASTIRKVTIVRHSSSTHAFDMGQRLTTLAFQPSADGLSLTVTAPGSGRIAPPGPYLLFILNDKGVPSVAQTILLSQ